MSYRVGELSMPPGKAWLCAAVSNVLTIRNPRSTRREIAFAPNAGADIALPRWRSRGMSQKTVQLVIGRLVTDEAAGAVRRATARDAHLSARPGL
jgi:hypothetical protein